MGNNTYPASTAVQFVAIGRAQAKANKSKNVYVEDRLLYAADTIAKRPIGKHNPDLPDFVFESDLESAINADNDCPKGSLADAGDVLIDRAMENTRHSVRRRHAAQGLLPNQQIAGRDRRADVDDRLDLESLATRLPYRQREAVLRRANGEDDATIAAALKIQPAYVPVLVHRGAAAIKKMATKADRANPDTP